MDAAFRRWPLFLLLRDRLIRLSMGVERAIQAAPEALFPDRLILNEGRRSRWSVGFWHDLRVVLPANVALLG
jgi:hypothetical protein